MLAPPTTTSETRNHPIAERDRRRGAGARNGQDADTANSVSNVLPMAAAQGVDRQPSWRFLHQRVWTCVLGLWLAGIACVAFDRTLSSWFLAGNMPGELRGLFHRGEIFGHGYGVLGICSPIFLVDRSRRWRLGLIALGFAAAGLSADVIKLQVWRLRPYAMMDTHQVGHGFVGSWWTGQTAEGPLLHKNAYYSFPSAHMAGATAFALGLARLYPAARPCFLLLAVLCGLNRIDGGAHFVSDVLWGAGLGVLIHHAVVTRFWHRFARRDQANAEDFSDQNDSWALPDQAYQQAS